MQVKAPSCKEEAICEHDPLFKHQISQSMDRDKVGKLFVEPGGYLASQESGAGSEEPNRQLSFPGNSWIPLFIKILVYKIKRMHCIVFLLAFHTASQPFLVSFNL